jgi:hypothetical protein
MSPFPPGLEPIEDLRQADWVREALKYWPRGRGFLVHDLVPPIFESYARILHRAHRPEDRRYPTGRWADRAEQLGRTFGPETSWYELTGTNFADGPARDAWVPNEGSSSEEEVKSLAALLSGYTSTPSACWFAMWSGWGDLSGGSSALYRSGGGIAELKFRWRNRLESQRARREAARLKTFPLLGQSGRSYLLFSGAVDDASRFDLDHRFQSPALWWPDDRSWFVHTEIDAVSTYLGGSQALVDSLVGQQVLESFEVEKDSRAAM